MSSKIIEEKDGEFGGLAEYVYANPASIFYQLVDPKDLYIIGGRATGKTTDIQAKRALRIQRSMPGAYFAFVGDYYSNLLGNTVPSMIQGWNELGFREGEHYVTNERPPRNWAQPYKNPLSYKHTITINNGCFYKLASMDVVSSLAGDSYQHIHGDEAKYLDKKKLDKLMPAKRGQRMRFEGSPYYLGVTFTTDMPDVHAANEFDWILQQESFMDRDQIKLILEISLVCNQTKKEMMKAYLKKDRLAFERHRKSLARWLVRLYKARRSSTLFHVVSSFANANILTYEWFEDQLKFGIEEFKTAILSLPKEVKSGEKFYHALELEKHLYEDGKLATFFDSAGFGETILEDCRVLRYLVRSAPLKAACDFGNMCSMITGQKQGMVERIMKSFYTLAPEFIPALAQKFVNFYQYQSYKLLYLHYDRSANSNKQIKRDYANELKDVIEGASINGIPQGWKVVLMDEGRETIYQEEEFNLVNQMLGENNTSLPLIRIDRYQCVELISSVRLAKMIVKKDRLGNNRIHKNKNSEKLALASLPMQSTNFSDALKYYLCTREYMGITKAREINVGSAPKVY